MWPVISGCQHKQWGPPCIWEFALKPYTGAWRMCTECRSETLNQRIALKYFPHALDTVPSGLTMTESALPLPEGMIPRGRHWAFASWLLRESMLLAPWIGWGECRYGVATRVSSASQPCIPGNGPATWWSGWWGQEDKKVLTAATWLVGWLVRPKAALSSCSDS